MTDTGKAVPAPDISVKKAVGDAWSMTGGQIGFALKKVWLAALLVFALRCLSHGLVGTISPALLGTVTTIGEALVCTFVAIFFHRLYLLKDREYRFDKGIYGRFLMMFAILNMALYALSITHNAFVQSSESVPGPLMFASFVVYVITAILGCRMLIIFPATAIGQKRSLAWAWGMTKNYGWAICGGWVLFFLLYLPFALLLLGVYFALDLRLDALTEFDWRVGIFEFLGAFVTALTSGAAAVYASSIFRQLRALKDEQGGASSVAT